MRALQILLLGHVSSRIHRHLLEISGDLHSSADQRVRISSQWTCPVQKQPFTGLNIFAQHSNRRLRSRSRRHLVLDLPLGLPAQQNMDSISHHLDQRIVSGLASVRLLTSNYHGRVYHQCIHQQLWAGNHCTSTTDIASFFASLC